ncbi:bifunctional folylpolyglutamate synthase/dihydrofolate synthase [Moheibacter lacus]|uniref:Dihydrofolate synthase/folylpolyglutamate synthase n=1 Tax=Moheibacter lacus TaxID=2745851 RepID=A0A838ZMS2_9FLAO|nr:folylpolyglutamate synthase/dihydrofolate synthase family protein [Moheibacter lacus]MBA5628906.1 bifunctional folylpolyglutamate synthase/dihydrofolate synthase [Moheibacter lacus]
MNYNQTVSWLYQKLPMFQRTGVSAYKKDLGNIRALMEHLGNPHEKFKSIHVAGTNGKGSTTHMLASIFQESGYKTGLTTSPHLKDFRERIRLNGKVCSEEFVIDFVEKNAAFIESLQASFFEVSIAMAFTYYAQEKVDIAIVETGLGGRLDSTNIIRPELSIITNIGLDHTGILGETLSEIASEKAGIIKPNVPVIIGESSTEIQAVYIQKAVETNSKIHFAEEFIFPNYDSDLKGIYQEKNKRTVLTAIEMLNKQGFEISQNAIQSGLKNVISNTGLRGRWEILQENPTIIADTAHNPHGLAEIQKQLSQTNYENLHLVLGFVNDKDVLSILEFFPKDAQYYFCQPDVPRKLELVELKKMIPQNLKAEFIPDVRQALEKAKSKAGKSDLIYVGGSTFVVAEII